jgi:hypothetical protein
VVARRFDPKYPAFGAIELLGRPHQWWLPPGTDSPLLVGTD